MEAEAEEANAAAADAPARDQVFSTPELAEATFINSTQKQILISVQRVCRQWKAIIYGSTPIQQALFLKPISTSKHISLPNPSRRYHFMRSHVKDDLWSIICLHPAFDDLLHEWSKKNRGLVRRSQLHYEGASWRKALLSQPQLPRLIVRTEIVDEKAGDITGIRKLAIDAPKDGLTLGYVMHKLEECWDDTYVVDLIPRSVRWHIKEDVWSRESIDRVLAWIKGPLQ